MFDGGPVVVGRSGPPAGELDDRERHGERPGVDGGCPPVGAVTLLTVHERRAEQMDDRQP